jgi:hypothetical protein
MWVIVEDSNKMNLENFGGVKLFRPRASSEVKWRIDAEDHLRSKFTSNEYAGETINLILQHQFSFFEKNLETLLPRIASQDFLSFLLFQYDESVNVNEAHKSGTLSQEESKRWGKLGPIFRRAIKYLIESVTMMLPDKSIKYPSNEVLDCMDGVWICAEELVSLYTLSDQTFMVFPNETKFSVLPYGEDLYWKLEVENECGINILDKIVIDRENRSRFIQDSSIMYNIEVHDQILSESFSKDIGARYIDLIRVINTLIDAHVEQDTTSNFPIPVLNLNNIINQISKFLNLPEHIVRFAISGFSINKTKLLGEGRKIRKPKQEYRLFRRGFIEITYKKEPHILFSKKMAQESMLQLIGGAVFQKVPREWHSKSVEGNLSTLSNSAGTWFESIVLKNLTTIGIKGIAGVKKLKYEKKNIQIPLGEIDYIGYSEREDLLVIAECKMVRGGIEAQFFRDDISQFISERKSFVNKFMPKSKWVMSNIELITNHLKFAMKPGTFNKDIKPKSIAFIIITYYPTIASCRIKDIPCVSLTELMMQYEDQGQWPYKIGMQDVGVS